MALDHALLDGVVVGAVVHEVPGLVGHVARGVGVAWLQSMSTRRSSNASSCSAGSPGGHARQRVGGGLAPHRRGQHEAIAQASSGPRAMTPYSPGVARLHLLRVFCDENGSGGNALAVFLDGAEVPPERRQGVAAELGLSETVFVDDAGHGTIRIFTPATELHFAGHPTVGTAWLLAREREPVAALRPPAGEVSVRYSGDESYVAGRPEWGPQLRVPAAGLGGGGGRPRRHRGRRRHGRRMGLRRRGRRRGPGAGLPAWRSASPRTRPPARPRSSSVRGSAASSRSGRAAAPASSRVRSATGAWRSAAAACSTTCATTPVV